jgi:hypothetical protein
VKSTEEQVEIINNVLSITGGSRDDLIQGLLHAWVIKIIMSDETDLYPTDELIRRVNVVFGLS